MSEYPVPKSGVMKISAYKAGKSVAAPGKTAIKLSSNESPLGASPKAMEALGALAKNLPAYPDPGSTALRKALGDVYGLDASRIMVGAGSDEILHLLAQAYLGEGDEAVISEFGFLMYPIVTLGAGAVPVYAKDKDYRVDVDAMLAAISDKTKIVFLANPNNPTGTYLEKNELLRLHKGLRDDILLVIDSAYAEYVSAPDYGVGDDLVMASQNVVMVRTFSKIGLASLRIGWMLGPEKIVDAINRIRGPFNVNFAAQIAGEAAVRDVEFTEKLKAHNAKWRDWLSAELSGNSIRVIPSQGNFILTLFASEDHAKKANMALLANGLVVREMGAYGLSNGLRISIGEEKAMKAVAKVLRNMDLA
ncbi:MAG: histidinol-phosphate transaminase [Devosiaceae bacterium]|nr:histidinol-phosphate transaminase [Devosiaceae bacterium]